MKHYYPDVPGIGNVAVSRHAQDRMRAEGITADQFEAALLRGNTTPDGQQTVWREHAAVRVVIVLRPEPFRGATLATTVYRVQPQKNARRA